MFIKIDIHDAIEILKVLDNTRADPNMNKIIRKQISMTMMMEDRKIYQLINRRNFIAQELNVEELKQIPHPDFDNE